jgi:hypothetical protein
VMESLQYIQVDGEFSEEAHECLEKFVAMQEKRHKEDIRLLESVRSRVEARLQSKVLLSGQERQRLSDVKFDEVQFHSGSGLVQAVSVPCCTCHGLQC